MLVGSLFSAFSYWRAAQTETIDPNNSRSWLSLGRGGFVLQFASIVGVFGVLYFIITRHLFEYNYAYQHSSRKLPMKYLLSCFWEGQEGSFLLWSFWQAVLGLVLMRTGKGLESRSMTVVALVQAALATMLLGFRMGDAHQIGSTPFLLLRHQMQGAPIFALPNYMQFIQDGNGLNELLQNYWMVIHPPVLFLGFASTLFPFALVVAALWKGDWKSWVKPAQRWALFGGGVLGIGIMMGGAWAYESLTFGGYWAWDPVENASLVPWLTLVAGLHTVLIYKATGRSLMISFVFLLLSYLLVWYSTFLTRTGILGDTSVHAFTGEGSSLSYHLIAVIALLLVASAGLLIYRAKALPRVKTEEAASSREFWMFIGSFVLLLSAIHIILVTSIPVYAPLVKAISGREIAPPVKPVDHYNSIQVWVGIMIGLLSASALYLKYKTTSVQVALKKLGIVALVAAGLTTIVAIGQKVSGGQYILFLFAAVFGLVASLWYAIGTVRNLRKSGAALTHFGFALMLLGILLSSYNKEVISINTLGVTMDFGKKDARENARESQENVILFRNTPVAMGDYQATYLGDSTSTTDPRTFYRVHYDRVENGKVAESFTLYPDAFINPKGQQGLIANPASKHYLHKDIFTYVTQAIDPSRVQDTAAYTTDTLRAGDTAFFNAGYFIFTGFDRAPKNADAQAGDVAVGATLQAYTLSGPVGKSITPVFVIRGEQGIQHEDTLRELGLMARLTNILPQSGSAVLEYRQRRANDDYIVLKALVFPYINVLWLGIIVMGGGFMLSLFNHAARKKARQAIPE